MHLEAGGALQLNLLQFHSLLLQHNLNDAVRYLIM
jgi:hypothetical protein